MDSQNTVGSVTLLLFLFEGADIHERHLLCGEAVDSLLHKGVNGPVVFNINNGHYDGLTLSGKIPGSSSTNTVTFTSVSGVADSVVIGGSDTVGMKLDSVSHLVFRNLTVGGTTSKNYVAVKFAGYIENVLFHHCNLYADTAATDSVSRVVEYANYPNTPQLNPIYRGGVFVGYDTVSLYMKDVHFVGNEVRGGYYGFYFTYAGNSAANCTTTASRRAAVLIDSNHIYDQYEYPVYSYYYTHIGSFSYNTIEARSGAQNNHGVCFSYYNLIDSIIGNRIHINVTDNVYSGIRLYENINSTSTFGTNILPVLVANNEIICNGKTTACGICTQRVQLNIVNNSIYCKADTNYGFYIGTQGTAYDELNIFKNIVMSENGSSANYLMYHTAVATLTSYPTMIDYNDYYTTDTNKNNFYVGGAKNFATWQSNYGMDSDIDIFYDNLEWNQKCIHDSGYGDQYISYHGVEFDQDHGNHDMDGNIDILFNDLEWDQECYYDGG